MKDDHASLDTLILALLATLVMFGVLMMWKQPAYEAGSIAVVGVITNVFSAACGAKWGLTQGGKPESYSPQSEAKTLPNSPDQKVIS